MEHADSNTASFLPSVAPLTNATADEEDDDAAIYQTRVPTYSYKSSSLHQSPAAQPMAAPWASQTLPLPAAHTHSHANAPSSAPPAPQRGSITSESHAVYSSNKMELPQVIRNQSEQTEFRADTAGSESLPVYIHAGELAPLVRVAGTAGSESFPVYGHRGSFGSDSRYDELDLSGFANAERLIGREGERRAVLDYQERLAFVTLTSKFSTSRKFILDEIEQHERRVRPESTARSAPPAVPRSRFIKEERALKSRRQQAARDTLSEKEEIVRDRILKTESDGTANLATHWLSYIVPIIAFGKNEMQRLKIGSDEGPARESLRASERAIRSRLTLLSVEIAARVSLIKGERLGRVILDEFAERGSIRRAEGIARTHLRLFCEEDEGRAEIKSCIIDVFFGLESAVRDSIQWRENNGRLIAEQTLRLRVTEGSDRREIAVAEQIQRITIVHSRSEQVARRTDEECEGVMRQRVSAAERAERQGALHSAERRVFSDKESSERSSLHATERRVRGAAKEFRDALVEQIVTRRMIEVERDVFAASAVLLLRYHNTRTLMLNQSEWLWNLFTFTARESLSRLEVKGEEQQRYEQLVKTSVASRSSASLKQEQREEREAKQGTGQKAVQLKSIPLLDWGKLIEAEASHRAVIVDSYVRVAESAGMHKQWLEESEKKNEVALRKAIQRNMVPTPLIHTIDDDAQSALGQLSSTASPSKSRPAINPDLSPTSQYKAIEESLTAEMRALEAAMKSDLLPLSPSMAVRLLNVKPNDLPSTFGSEFRTAIGQVFSVPARQARVLLVAHGSVIVRFAVQAEEAWQAPLRLAAARRDGALRKALKEHLSFAFELDEEYSENNEVAPLSSRGGYMSKQHPRASPRSNSDTYNTKPLAAGERRESTHEPIAHIALNTGMVERRDDDIRDSSPEEKVAAAIHIQKEYRGFTARRVFSAKRAARQLSAKQRAATDARIAAAILIQSVVRAWRARRRVKILKAKQEVKVKRNLKAIAIQTMLRGYFARKLTRSLKAGYSKKTMRKIELENRIAAAIQIQSMFRAFKARSAASARRKTKTGRPGRTTSSKRLYFFLSDSTYIIHEVLKLLLHDEGLARKDLEFNEERSRDILWEYISGGVFKMECQEISSRTAVSREEFSVRRVISDFFYSSHKKAEQTSRIESLWREKFQFIRRYESEERSQLQELWNVQLRKFRLQFSWEGLKIGISLIDSSEGVHRHELTRQHGLEWYSLAKAFDAGKVEIESIFQKRRDCAKNLTDALKEERFYRLLILQTEQDEFLKLHKDSLSNRARIAAWVPLIQVVGPRLHALAEEEQKVRDDIIWSWYWGQQRLNEFGERELGLVRRPVTEPVEAVRKSSSPIKDVVTPTGVSGSTVKSKVYRAKVDSSIVQSILTFQDEEMWARRYLANLEGKDRNRLIELFVMR